MTTAASRSKQKQARPPSQATTTEAPTTTEPPPETVELSWADNEGWEFTAVASAAEVLPDESPGGCVPTANPGTSNVFVNLKIVNEIDDRPAPYPNLILDDNLNEDATAATPGITNEEAVSSSDRLIEITPNDSNLRCRSARILWGFEIDEEIPAGGSTDFTIVSGPLPTPVAAGTEILVEYYDVNGDEGYWSIPVDDILVG